MALHRGYATVLVMVMTRVTGVHARGVWRISVSLGELSDRCGAIVMDSRHRYCHQGLPGQYQNEQHYRKVA